MNKPIPAENTPSRAVASDEQRGIRTTELLFNTVILGAAVVCAIAGPKLPTYEGD